MIEKLLPSDYYKKNKYLICMILKKVRRLFERVIKICKSALETC